jgi:hypothetical protein
MLSTNQKTTGNSGTGFASPQDVIDDDGLTLEKKLAVLEGWQNDLIEMQRAEEENMVATASQSSQTAKCLTEVTKAIHALRDR